MQEAEGYQEDASHHVPLSQPESIETLRAKLHAKIEAMRSKKRGGAEGNSKDELLEERRLHRAAMRERRRKETKAKIARERERKGKTKERSKETAPPAKVSQTCGQCLFSESFSCSQTQLLVTNGASSHSKLDSRSQLTNVAFSSIAESSSSNHKGSRLKGSSNPAQALQQLTSWKEKLSSLPEERRKQVEEREKWEKAAARMEGAKVFDDEVRLRRAAKRNEKEKAKSKRAWCVFVLVLRVIVDSDAQPGRGERSSSLQIWRRSRRSGQTILLVEMKKGRKSTKVLRENHVQGSRVKHLERGRVNLEGGGSRFDEFIILCSCTIVSTRATSRDRSQAFLSSRPLACKNPPSKGLCSSRAPLPVLGSVLRYPELFLAVRYQYCEKHRPYLVQAKCNRGLPIGARSSACMRNDKRP